MAKHRPIRGEIKKVFNELYGVDYGVAIGLLFGEKALSARNGAT